MSPADTHTTIDMAPGRTRFGKTGLLIVVVAVVVTLDQLTKFWIVRSIGFHEQVQVIGDFFRLTYTHNPGAAFGINIGEYSPIFFLVLSLAALVVLGLIYRSTPVTDRVRLLAVSLVSGGAIGNIIDRVLYNGERLGHVGRFHVGVVDFLDFEFIDIVFNIGMFNMDMRRWPVFNVADMAVSTGAVLLLFSFYLEGRRERSAEDTG